MLCTRKIVKTLNYLKTPISELQNQANASKKKVYMYEQNYGTQAITNKYKVIYYSIIQKMVMPTLKERYKIHPSH